MHSIIYSDNDILHAIWLASIEVGKDIRYHEYDDWRRNYSWAPSAASVTRRLGSWNHAKEELDLFINNKHYTTEEICENLLQCISIHGWPLSYTKYKQYWQDTNQKNNNVPNPQTIYNWFDSFKDIYIDDLMEKTGRIELEYTIGNNQDYLPQKRKLPVNYKQILRKLRADVNEMLSSRYDDFTGISFVDFAIFNYGIRVRAHSSLYDQFNLVPDVIRPILRYDLSNINEVKRQIYHSWKDAHKYFFSDLTNIFNQ